MKITQFYNLDSVKINEFLSELEKGSEDKDLWLRDKPKKKLKAVLKQLEVNENVILHLRARINLLLLRG